MKKNIGKHFAAASLILAMGHFSPVDAAEISAGIRAGTLGAGVEIGTTFNEYFSGRIGGNFFSYSYESTEDDIEYDLDLRLFTIAPMLDYHPFGGGFRLTGGLFYNGNELDGESTITDTFKIGDRTFSSGEVGTLGATIDFNQFVPYAGIGYGTYKSPDGKWQFSMDIGVIFQGAPSVDLVSRGGTLSNNPLLLSELQKEEDSLQEDLDFFEYYPVIMFGATYTF